MIPEETAITKIEPKGVKMRWFKHYANSNQNEGLCLLRNQFGWDGYGRYWRILEEICQKMDDTSCCSVTYSLEEWMKILNMKSKKLIEFFEFLKENTSISYQLKESLSYNKVHRNPKKRCHILREFCGSSAGVLREFCGSSAGVPEILLHVTCPKMLNLKDNWSEKNKKTTKLLRSKEAEEEKEKEKNREINNNNTNPITRARVQKFLTPVVDFNFLKFLDLYPKRISDRKKDLAAIEWASDNHRQHLSKISTWLEEQKQASWQALIDSGEERYIPDPHNFLRKKMYFQKIETPSTPAQELDSYTSSIIEKLKKES